METRTLIFFLLGFTISQSLSANIPVHIHIQDPSSEADVDIPASEDDAMRIKRSGSGYGTGSGSPDFFGYIKRGITGKISQLASASAGASASFSKGSSGGGGGYYYPSPHDSNISYGGKFFDFWTLKKSILNTLLQAVKAINGGIIAIKGKLIQGGGAIISAKGRLISMKGEAIANVGRHIIMNAKLSPSSGYHSKPVITYSAPSAHPSYGPPSHDYGPASSPSAPSASSPTGGYLDHPPSTYGAPTASAYGPPIGPSSSAIPSQAYLPQKVAGPYDALKNKLKFGAHAGIVILKKIPKATKYQNPPHVGLPPSAPSPSAIASLPLQDERHKVVEPTVDVTKTSFYSPQAPKTTPFLPTAPTAPTKSHSFFETSLKDFHPPKPIHGSPLDAPPTPTGSAPSAPSAPSSLPTGPSPLPTGPSALSAPLLPTIPPESPTPFVDDSLLSSHGPNGFQFQNFDINKPFASLKDKFPNFDFKGLENEFKNYGNSYKNIENQFKNYDSSYLSKVPAPFDFNSYGGQISLPNYDLSLKNIPNNYSTHPDHLKTDLNTYAPDFSNSGPESTSFELKDAILQSGKLPEFEVVKSITYELPAHKRQ